MNTREDYINEFDKLRLALQGIVLLPDETCYTESEVEHMESVVDRAVFVSDVLYGIDAALATKAAQPAAQKNDDQDPNSTLALLNETAKHLSGRNVSVMIQEPANPRALAETFVEGGALKIAISPRAVLDGNLYLKAFLHEVAHVKLHVEAGSMKAYAGPEAEEGLEMQAHRQGDYWQHYAKTHTDITRDFGGASYPANTFRGYLLSLLHSQEAAQTTI